MKDILNLLLYSDINKFLKEEQVKYLAIYNGEDYYLKSLPIVYNGYFSALKKYLAYDYDELSDKYKNLYKNKYISLERINDNIYKEKTKIYTIKKNIK